MTDGSFCTTSSDILDEIRDDSTSFELFDVDHNKETSDPSKDNRNADREGVRSESEDSSRFDSFGFPLEDDLFASHSQTNTWPQLEEKSISSGITGNNSLKAKSQNYTASTCGSSFSFESTRHGKDSSFVDSVGNMSVDAFGFRLPPPIRDSPLKSVRSTPFELPRVTSCDASVHSVKSAPDLIVFKFNNDAHLELKAISESPTLGSETTTDDDLETDPDLDAIGNDVDEAKFNSNAILELKGITESPTLGSEPTIDNDLGTDPKLVAASNNVDAVIDLVLEKMRANTNDDSAPKSAEIGSVSDSFEALNDYDSVRLNNFEANEVSIEVHEDSIEVHEDSFEILPIPRRKRVPRKTPKVPPLMQECADIEWIEVEEKWERTVWEIVDILEDRFVKCGFLMGCHDYRGMQQRDKESAHGSLYLSQSNISEDAAAQDVCQDKSMSLDLTLSTISAEDSPTQNVRKKGKPGKKKNKDKSFDLFLSEDGKEPEAPLSLYSYPVGTF